jgi:hypothetical protein
MYTVFVIGSVWGMLILPHNFLMHKIENILPIIAFHLMPLARFFMNERMQWSRNDKGELLLGAKVSFHIYCSQ